MAKAYLTQNKRKGSVGGETYSIVKGQTIVKSKPVSVANPKTQAQMNQRSLFLDPVRFYQHANQNYFKLAFEDKKSVESDYNAFMRANASLGVNITKAMGDDPQWPALGNFIVSKGSLVSPAFSFSTSGGTWKLSATGLTGSSTTIGQLSAALKTTYGLNEGDIVTVVHVTSSLESVDSSTLAATYKDNAAPKWVIRQFKIDTSSTDTINSTFSGMNPTPAANTLSFDVTDSDCAEIMFCVFSRNTDTGLLVSNSQVQNNVTAAEIVTMMQSTSFREKVLASWGATEGAILQGGKEYI